MEIKFGIGDILKHKFKDFVEGTVVRIEITTADIIYFLAVYPDNLIEIYEDEAELVSREGEHND